MKDYSRGKIYKIVCNISGLVYVGSTCEPTLARRLAKHVGNFKTWVNNPEGTTGYMTSYIIIEGGNYDIVLLEEVKCESKDQLYARERYHIESITCVNKVIPTRTVNEYYKQYREKHIEHFKAKQCRVCDCLCGKQYTHSNKSIHEKSKYHQKYLKSQTEIIENDN